MAEIAWTLREAELVADASIRALILKKELIATGNTAFASCKN